MSQVQMDKNASCGARDFFPDQVISFIEDRLVGLGPFSNSVLEPS